MHPIRGQQPDAHRVDEAVVAVRLVEDRLATDGRDSDRVSVVADPRHCPAEVMVWLGEAKAVEERDRPRSHGHDVAENPADARRGALERLDRGRMVVRLDFERHRLALAEVDHAGVLSRALQDALTLRRETPQQEGGVLVAAVLGPEQREDGELEVVRLAGEQLADAVELLVGQPQRTVERLFRRDLRQGPECTRGRRRSRLRFCPW